jgi:RNA polymerase sigma factor (sigma-70 family)
LRKSIARAIAQIGRQLEAAETDAVLLRRYIASRDEMAFAQIVRKYGPMVLGVCKRVLHHLHDSEDAFQATFLILARKAKKVRSEELSRWLYGVAVRVALTQRSRSKKYESIDHLEHEATVPDRSPHDWIPLLDQALTKLPERYRLPILLCDLQGMSRFAASQELGIAEGTLSSRLSRGREHLRRKLSGLGFTVTLPALVQLFQDQASANTPNFSYQIGPASTKLAEGVMHHMAIFKLAKWSALGVSLAGITALGVVTVPNALAEPQSVVQESTKVKVASKEEAQKSGEGKSRLQQLREERVQLLEPLVEQRKARIRITQDPAKGLYDLLLELYDARIEAAQSDTGEIQKAKMNLLESLADLEKLL